jgi:large subunit ribosomal protein L15
MPLYRRLPKRGFKHVQKAQIETISLSDLEKFDDGADVTIEALLEKGIIRDAKDGVKVLANGELTKKVNVAVNAFSAAAKAKIEELGGKAEVI